MGDFVIFKHVINVSTRLKKKQLSYTGIAKVDYFVFISLETWCITASQSQESLYASLSYGVQGVNDNPDASLKWSSSVAIRIW